MSNKITKNQYSLILFFIAIYKIGFFNNKIFRSYETYDKYLEYHEYFDAIKYC